MKRIALVIGDDIHSQLVAHTFLTMAKPLDYRIHVFPTCRPAEQKNLCGTFATYRKMETSLFPVMIATLAKQSWDGQTNSIAMKKHYLMLGAVDYVNIANVNSDFFLGHLRSNSIDTVVSIRCYQKFGTRIVEAYSNPSMGRRILNLHPGKLPNYRGVLSYAHQLREAELTGTHTLHHMNTEWDSGPIIAVSEGPLLANCSVLANYCIHAYTGGEFLLGAVQASNLSMIGASKTDDTGRYWSGKDATKIFMDRDISFFLRMEDLENALHTVCKKTNVPLPNVFFNHELRKLLYD